MNQSANIPLVLMMFNIHSHCSYNFRKVPEVECWKYNGQNFIPLSNQHIFTGHYLCVCSENAQLYVGLSSFYICQLSKKEEGREEGREGGTVTQYFAKPWGNEDNHPSPFSYFTHYLTHSEWQKGQRHSLHRFHNHSVAIKNLGGVLARWLSWLERWPMHQKRCRFNSQSGHIPRLQV